MRLSDIMSSMGLSGYAELAMLLFMSVFLAIAVLVVSRRHNERWNAARYIPLDDEIPLEQRRANGSQPGNES